MAEDPPSSPTHHRQLPAAAAPAPSSTVSLRPHQVPPPPPAVIPAGFVPRVVLLPQEPPRPLLRSEVVGDLSSLSVEEELEEVPVSPLETAAMEAPELAACSSRPPSPQVLPPVELKLQEPGMAKSPALDMEGNELPWQEVRNKRRPGLNLAPPSPTRGGEDRAVVFRRRVRGRCFRCLAPDHRVAGCYGDIRCLSCNCSGHRERDCPQRLKNSQAPRCFKPPPSARRPDGSCSWG